MSLSVVEDIIFKPMLNKLFIDGRELPPTHPPPPSPPRSLTVYRTDLTT